MTHLDMTILGATPRDARVLAELVNQASEGLSLFIWRQMAEPGQDPWEVGRARVASEDAGISYRNA